MRWTTITSKHKSKPNFLCDGQYFHLSATGNSVLLGKVTNSEGKVSIKVGNFAILPDEND